jgi:hypothetical protein
MSNAKAAGPLVGVLRDLLLREIVKRQASPRGQAIPLSWLFDRHIGWDSPVEPATRTV